MDIRKSYIKKVVEHRHRLPREVGGCPSLETFKGRMDGALSNLL